MTFRNILYLQCERSTKKNSSQNHIQVFEMLYYLKCQIPTFDSGYRFDIGSKSFHFLYRHPNSSHHLCSLSICVPATREKHGKGLDVNLLIGKKFESTV